MMAGFRGIPGSGQDPLSPYIVTGDVGGDRSLAEV